MTLHMPTELDARGSVLFLGSGFSQFATNILGKNLPTSAELRTKLAATLDVDPEQYDLKTLADEVASTPGVSLFQMLYRMFTVQHLDRTQSDILSLPWYRIYTTNYDDAIEYAYSSSDRTIVSYSYDDKKPMKLPSRYVIHLHGTIRRATEENVIEQLILSESAYVRQHFERSNWYDEFVRDLRFCASCFFVGYSLRDYRISSILLQDPATKKKTYFVDKVITDPIFQRQVHRYGIVLPIGVHGFADLCRTLPAPKYVASPHTIKAFRFFTPARDRRILTPPTADEVLNLVTYGAFNYQRCFDNTPGARLRGTAGSARRRGRDEA